MLRQCNALEVTDGTTNGDGSPTDEGCLAEAGDGLRGERSDRGGVLCTRGHLHGEPLSVARVARHGGSRQRAAWRAGGGSERSGLCRSGDAGNGGFQGGAASRSGSRGDSAAELWLMFFAEGQIRVHLYGEPSD